MLSLYGDYDGSIDSDAISKFSLKFNLTDLLKVELKMFMSDHTLGGI